MMKMILTLFFFCGLSVSTWSAPVAPIEVILKQPSGIEFVAIPKGSQYLHWMETPMGYTVIKKNGAWYFATLNPNNELEASDELVSRSGVPTKVKVSKHLKPKLSPLTTEFFDLSS